VTMCHTINFVYKLVEVVEWTEYCGWIWASDEVNSMKN